jgi:cytochrome c oxidase subunit 3
MGVENIMKKSVYAHPFHIVNNSPWPIIVSLAAFFFTSTFVICVHRLARPFGVVFFLLSIVFLFFLSFFWWSDVIDESMEGYHTPEVANGLRLGFVLFIVSEVMFFFSFFWAFFYASLAPSIWIGCVWPPYGITPISPWGFPLLNTLFLLTSGLTVTFAHRALISEDYSFVQEGLRLTLLAAYSFMMIQFVEYTQAPFSIADGIYGSTFFMLTGFHGFHVLVGTIYLRVCLLRHARLHFSPNQHVGLETAIWYWHFVDVVWLFLFVVVYWWGSIALYHLRNFTFFFKDFFYFFHFNLKKI